MGLSGLAVSIARIGTKATILPTDAAGVRLSALVYFAIGALLMAACIIIYEVAHRSPYVVKQLNLLAKPSSNKNSSIKSDEKTALTKSKTPKNSNTIENGTNGTDNHSDEVDTVSSDLEISRVSVFKRIWAPCVFNFITYAVTIGVFPGVVSEIGSDWFTIALITIFNAFDLTGKMLPRWELFLERTPSFIPFGVAAFRILLMPALMLCVKPKVIEGMAAPIVLVVLLALSSGYCGSTPLFFFRFTFYFSLSYFLHISFIPFPVIEEETISSLSFPSY